MQMIRNLVAEEGDKWHEYLPEIIFETNTYIPNGMENSVYELIREKTIYINRMDRRDSKRRK
jgi:hypothetical protein